MKTLTSPLVGVLALAWASGPAWASAVQQDEPSGVPAVRGAEFAYVDPQLRVGLASRLATADAGTSTSTNPIYLALSRAGERYRATWGALPQVQIPAGPAITLGASGPRAELLRKRLGLAPGAGFDAGLAQRLRDYQGVHGLPESGVLDAATLASLNQGAEYYLNRIAVNLHRAALLPAAGGAGRYIVIDAGDAEALLYRNGRLADSMKVVVGSSKTQTPMLASTIQTASFNPYWNVPPELTRSLTAQRVLTQGLSYLKNYHYEVLADWTQDAPKIDPATIDWKRVAAGKQEVRVRQLPGPWNSLGAMKFEISNDFGIYLHDTPHKELFEQADRHLSNGCIRLEDYQRFASWVFDTVPQARSDSEQRFAPAVAVPVYVTYLTAEATDDGVRFRADPYGADAADETRSPTATAVQFASAD
jgi:murein L,D-transpeptidase YcbB/YkuD